MPVEGFAILWFLVAVGCGVAALVNWATARDLRRQVAQLRTQNAAVGQQLHGTHYHLQTEAGGRQAAQHQAQAAQHQAQSAQYQAQVVAEELNAVKTMARQQTTELSKQLAAAKKETEKAWNELGAVQREAASARQRAETAQRVASTVTEQLQAAQQELTATRTAARQEAAELRRETDRLTKLSTDVQKRGQQVADKYVTDAAKRAESDMTSSNFETSRTRVDKVISFCSSRGFPTSADRDAEISRALLAAYEAAVRREATREEQRRIKEQIREEQRADRERQKELERLEAEENRIEKALSEALAKAKGEHNTEVDRLKQMLAEAEARAQRAKSQAQLTKAGFVYVISNIGSFGDGTYKVGMTRRQEPMDRVVELGDASVPFSFDVHMMISCEDAPALETALHRALNHVRVNKVNLRKEFFRISLDEIAALVEQHHGKIDYRAEAEALEYRETLLMEQRGVEPAFDPRRDEEIEEPAIASRSEVEVDA